MCLFAEEIGRFFKSSDKNDLKVLAHKNANVLVKSSYCNFIKLIPLFLQHFISSFQMNPI